MRIDDVDPATMTGDQRALYDIYTTGARVAPESPFTLVDADGRLLGPPAIWIINPVFGRALQQIGSAVRFGSQLPARAREIAILLVGHHHDSAFELYAHERAGAAAGLTRADLAALAERKEPAGLSEVEACVLRTTVRILDAGTLDDDEFRDGGHRARRAGAARTDHDRRLLQHGRVAARGLRRPAAGIRVSYSIWILEYGYVERFPASNLFAAQPNEGHRRMPYCFGLVRSADRCVLVDTGFADPAVQERLTAKYGETRWCTPVDALARVGVRGRAGRHDPADPQPLRPRRLRRRLPRRARLHPAARDRVATSRRPPGPVASSS